MNEPRSRSKILWTVLLASLAFNAGVGGTLAVRGIQHRAERGPIDGHRRRKPPEIISDFFPAGSSGRRMMIEERDSLRKELFETRREMFSEQRKLAELMTVDPENREAALEQLERVINARSEMQRRVVTHFLDMRDRLDTPQQRDAFRDHVKHMLRHVFEGPGRGRGPGWGRGMGERRGMGHGNEFSRRRGFRPHDRRPEVENDDQ